MRKYTLVLLAFVLAICSCTENVELLDIAQQNVATANPKFRTNAEIKEIALQAFNALKGYSFEESTSRAGISLTIVPVLSHKSRSASDTLIQAVNFGDGQGFALVGALTGSEELLAFVEEGSYNPIETSQVEGFNDFVERAEAYVSSSAIVGDPYPVAKETKVERVYRLVKMVGPNVSVQWGQTDYFGTYCPNGIAGCVAIGATMALSYFEQPTSMALTFPEKDTEKIELDWTSIKSHFKRHSDVWPGEWEGTALPDAANCPASDLDHANLGRVAREIGHRINATYKPGSTGAYTDLAVELVQELVPNVKVRTFTTTTDGLLNYFESGVVLARGSDNEQSVGHCWIIDGWATLSVTDYTYELSSPLVSGDWELVKTEFIGMDIMVHQNWGWNGLCNGYFLRDCYDPNEGYEYDAGANNPNVDYNFGRNNTYYSISAK